MTTNSRFQMSVADLFVALASAPIKTGVHLTSTSGTSVIKSLSLRVTYVDTRGRGTLACSHTSDIATGLEYLKSTPPPLPASLDGSRYGYTWEVITNLEGRELGSVRRGWEPSCRTSQVPDVMNCSHCSVSFSPFSACRLQRSVMLTLCSNIHTIQYLVRTIRLHSHCSLMFTPFSDNICYCSLFCFINFINVPLGCVLTYLHLCNDVCPAKQFNCLNGH